MRASRTIPTITDVDIISASPQISGSIFISITYIYRIFNKFLLTVSLLLGDVGVRSLFGDGRAITVWDMGERSLFGMGAIAFGIMGCDRLLGCGMYDFWGCGDAIAKRCCKQFAFVGMMGWDAIAFGMMGYGCDRANSS